MLTYSVLAYVNKNRIRDNSSKEGKLFPELFDTVVALNKAVLFSTLQHVLPLVTLLNYTIQREGTHHIYF